MVPAGREERRLPAETGDQVEAQQIVVEGDRAIQVGDFQWTWPMWAPAGMDCSDMGLNS